jgi:hypothetical protein
MEIFAQATGFANRKNALAKLAKVLPDYETFHYFIVALPEGRFLPVVRVTGTDRSWMGIHLAEAGVGVI